MPNSDEVRRLGSKWRTDTGWPLRLEWVDISGIRGWSGQRFELRFPIMAVVGENGVGKSTVLQSAASVYRSPAGAADRFASDFFPDTPWDQVENASIRASIREGTEAHATTIRKPTNRWRGNPERRERHVEYIDLSRVQPVSGRVGYKTLANPAYAEAQAEEFEKSQLTRLRSIMGRAYELAKMAITDADAKREVPVVTHNGAEYSGFHQGAGETTIAELLRADLPRHSLVLIDEVESSLHPRAQRRLIRDLAARARELELQVVLTTHSPYVLEELPYEARACIVQTPQGAREIVYGVSPQFAMTKMDDVHHAEGDVYVEDPAAAVMLTEILVASSTPDLVRRVQVVPFGAASVGRSLGQMVLGSRFPRPSCVFLDGDEGEVGGCHNLPGEDAPERVVFEALRARDWLQVHERTGRQYADVADSCGKAMALADHHHWLTQAASNLFLSGEMLWQAMCAEWAASCLDPGEVARVADAVENALLSAEARAAAPVAMGDRVERTSTGRPPRPASGADGGLEPELAGTEPASPPPSASSSGNEQLSLQ